MTTGYEANFYREFGELVRVGRDSVDVLHSIDDTLSKQVEATRAVEEALTSVEEDAPLIRIAAALEKIADKLPSRPTFTLGTAEPAFPREEAP